MNSVVMESPRLSVTRKSVDEFSFSSEVHVSSRILDDEGSFYSPIISTIPRQESSSSPSSSSSSSQLGDKENARPGRRSSSVPFSSPCSSGTPRRTLERRHSSLKSSPSSSRNSRRSSSVQKSRRFSEEVQVFEIPSRESFSDIYDELFYSDEDIAEMRNEAFMESCGLSTEDFEDFDLP